VQTEHYKLNLQQILKNKEKHPLWFFHPVVLTDNKDDCLTHPVGTSHILDYLTSCRYVAHIDTSHLSNTRSRSLLPPRGRLQPHSSSPLPELYPVVHTMTAFSSLCKWLNVTEARSDSRYVIHSLQNTLMVQLEH
jgi:hypothetical protein